MSNNQKETTAERLARMKREKEEARQLIQETNEIVSQLTHQDDGESDFTEIARKLQERKEREAKGENDGYVKMTIYIRQDVADSFNALITKRGQQKEYANEAFIDFVQKKVRELGLQ